MSSMSSLSRNSDRELPVLTLFFQTMLPLSTIVCTNYWSTKCLMLKDVADFQDMPGNQAHLITYLYSSDGPSNETTWKSECKSEIFFLGYQKFPVEIIF
jgi:hypothetical protein